MSRPQKIWIAMGTIAVTVICVFVAVSIWPRPSAGPDDVLDEYLHAVQDKNNMKIADLTCSAVTAAGTPPLRMIPQPDVPGLREWNILGADEGDRNAEVQTWMKVDAFNRGEELEYTVTFSLVEEDGEWRVCGGSARRSSITVSGLRRISGPPAVRDMPR